MKYMGSKARFAKELCPIIENYLVNKKGYLEPFVGGANLIDKINFHTKYGSDINPYVIAVLKQAQKDVTAFPKDITLEQYKDIQHNKDGYEDWLVGFVGFGCSFGSRFFEGYARGKQSNGTERNYALETYNNLNKQALNLQGIHFKCCDYKDININIKDWVIYCDIPYNDAKKYSGVSNFNHADFYKWCELMGKYNTILVSEYNMPDKFKCIWEKETKVLLDSNRKQDDNKNIRTERLFIYES